MKAYIDSLNKQFLKGNSTEHSYRPFLITLINSLSSCHATNEPKRRECGAPDIVVEKNNVAIGFFETKDIIKSIEKEKKTEQIERYKSSLTNFIVTNYLEFTWFVYGKEVQSVKIGEIKRGKIVIDENEIQSLSKLLTVFLSQKHPTISSSKELAFKMAQSAQLIKHSIFKALQSEDKGGSLRYQLDGFKQVLLPNLDGKGFADMYAQTICYGLFAARVNSNSKDFSRKNAAYDLPKTNPFLRKMFSYIAGPDLDNRITWILDDFAELLNCANISAIIEEFTKNAKHKDPIIHFYEDFLEEYDPSLRKLRGVFYTPEPVVEFITNSINKILINEFKITDGIANKDKVDINGKDVHKVLLLDPAVGTGTFLQKVIEKTHEQFSGQKGMWSSYVSEHLLPRLFGFEILMAPYSIAHMKLGFKLAETGYDFKSDERLNVFLTNTLEEIVKTESLMPFTKWLTEEASAANYVKKDLPILVVFGNPPYSGISSNKGKWIVDLLKGKLPDGESTLSYFEAEGEPLGEKKTWLQDDYVKFIRWAQHRIDQTGSGVLAFITNHGFIDNKTFRGMREKLLMSFSQVYTLDLHGNSNKGEVDPNGEKDENVFDIQQGVSINIFIKKDGHKGLGEIFHHEIYGSRESKYDWLEKNDIESVEWKKVKKQSPHFYFKHVKESASDFYMKWPKLDEVMTANISGIVTSRDDLVIDMYQEALVSRMYDFVDEEYSDSEIRKKFNLKENYAWRLSKARVDLKKHVFKKNLNEYVKPILYRPFDRRKIFFNDSVVWRTRGDVMLQLLDRENIALIASGQTKNKWNVFVTDCLAGHKTCASYDINNIFPLYIYPIGQLELDTFHHFKAGENERRPNFTQAFIDEFSSGIELDFNSDGEGDLVHRFGPEDLFNYMYAIFYSDLYIKDFGDNLKRNYPRIPLCNNLSIFRSLVRLGKQLVDSHNLKRQPDSKIGKFPIVGGNTIENIKYSKEKGRIYINDIQFFEGVESDVWSFCFGGYQVCEKWLKDRKGLDLNYDELNYYLYMIRSVRDTILISKKIDEIIINGDGWNSFIKKDKINVKNIIPFNKLPSSHKKRLALSSLIIDSMKNDKSFGRVKFAKIFYILDQRSNENLETMYYREIAGPLDYSLFYDEKLGIEKLGEQLGLFNVSKNEGRYTYKSQKEIEHYLLIAKEFFSDEFDELEKLLKIFKPMKAYQAEIVATLYACWNDLIIKNKKKPTKKQIMDDFFKSWHQSKVRFSEEKISIALDWMKEKNIIPDGRGNLTKIKKKGKLAA